MDINALITGVCLALSKSEPEFHKCAQHFFICTSATMPKRMSTFDKINKCIKLHHRENRCGTETKVPKRPRGTGV